MAEIKQDLIFLYTKKPLITQIILRSIVARQENREFFKIFQVDAYPRKPGLSMQPWVNMKPKETVESRKPGGSLA